MTRRLTRGQMVRNNFGISNHVWKIGETLATGKSEGQTNCISWKKTNSALGLTDGNESDIRMAQQSS